MTTLSLRPVGLTTLLIAVIEKIGNAFGSFGKSIMLARAAQANAAIAPRLLHEYPEHTVTSLTAELNRKSIKDILG